MSRPTLEVADIVRAVGNRFWEKHKQHFAWVHRKVLDAIVRCRTAALGGHRDKCVRCGHLTASYNSCIMGSNSIWRVIPAKGANYRYSKQNCRFSTPHYKGGPPVGASLAL
jgi:hypothetical protein